MGQNSHEVECRTTSPSAEEYGSKRDLVRWNMLQMDQYYSSKDRDSAFLMYQMTATRQMNNPKKPLTPKQRMSIIKSFVSA
jgi:hypothetical protein